jgi:predicted GH43/DUF377 family glycosyl hydrolase
MPRKFRQDVIHRWRENPVINFENLPFRCHDMYNAGCIKIDGEYILLITIEKLDGRPAIYFARSEDGLYFNIERNPFITSSPDEDFKEYEEMGVLDARITPIDGEYYIIYLAMGRHGIVLSIGKTKDFKTFERMGIISQPDNKAGALFPRKLNGKFAMLERPNTGDGIWIAYSNDLLTWGEREAVLSPRGGFWDQGRIGCAVPPIETEAGWLLFYYGVKKTSGGTLTRIGAAILDKDNPTKIINRSNIPILSPRELYERIGDLNNVIFSTGAILEESGEIKLYYGAADNCICLGTTTLSEIVDFCRNGLEEF